MLSVTAGRLRQRRSTCASTTAQRSTSAACMHPVPKCSQVAAQLSMLVNDGGQAGRGCLESQNRRVWVYHSGAHAGQRPGKRGNTQ
jgi:hypothetical protein